MPSKPGEYKNPLDKQNKQYEVQEAKYISHYKTSDNIKETIKQLTLRYRTQMFLNKGLRKHGEQTLPAHMCPYSNFPLLLFSDLEKLD